MRVMRNDFGSTLNAPRLMLPLVTLLAIAAYAQVPAQAQTSPPPAPAALPAESSTEAGVREMFKKYGLFGRWSVKCGEYSTTEWVDARPIQQIEISGEERLSGTVEQAIEIVPGEILITSLWAPRLAAKLRIEGERSRVIESSLNGVKEVEGGIELRRNSETSWLARCQVLPPPQVSAAPGSARYIMEKYGALGVWASDCSKSPSPSNRYEVFRAMDEKFVQVDVMQSPTERAMAFIIDSVVEDGSNQFAYTYTFRFRDVVRLLIEHDRVRELEQVRDGKRIVEDGRFHPEKTLETPWSQRCTDVALASAGSSAGNPNEGWIGVQIQGVGEDEAKGLGLQPGIKGARIIAILDGSPGFGSMQAGDIVFAVNGENIAGIEDFAGKIRARKPGSEVALTVWRDGSKREMTIKLVARPANPSAMMGIAAPGLAAVEPPASESTPSPAMPEDPPLPADVAEMESLASSYAYGLSGKPQDEKEAARLYSQVAERAGPRKIKEIAGRFEIGSGVPKDLAEAARLYRKAAELGNPEAMVEIGRALGNGYGVSENDLEAIDWYRKAVDRGDARAMFYLGMAYRYGEGTKKDTAEAARWFRQAAEGGETVAMTSLAELYEAGDGVPKDDAEAARWRQAAQSAGN